MTDKTITSRSARFRAATREAGGRQLSVTISATAAQALDAIRRRDGVTVRAAVERALIAENRGADKDHGK